MLYQHIWYPILIVSLDTGLSVTGIEAPNPVQKFEHLLLPGAQIFLSRFFPARDGLLQFSLYSSSCHCTLYISVHSCLALNLAGFVLRLILASLFGTLQATLHSTHEITCGVCFSRFSSSPHRARADAVASDISRLGFPAPSHIQAQAWPVAMKGRDLVGACTAHRHQHQ